jgi:hypothetical protein
MKGLYDLVEEHFGASIERRKEIEAERADRFPFVKGWPQYPNMIYREFGPNAWAWSLPAFGVRFVDDDGNIVGGGLGEGTDPFWGPFERLKSDRSYAHAAADFLRLNLALGCWPEKWGNSFQVELFGSFRLKGALSFKDLGVTIDGRREFGKANFGARWFYGAKVNVRTRDLAGFLNGLERLERAIGVLHLASVQSFRNCGPGVAIQYQCAFFEFEVWGPELATSDWRAVDITESRGLALSISADVAALEQSTALLVWRAVWWIRHARHDEFTGQQHPSLFLIYLSYWNALECLIQAVEFIKPPAKPSKNEKNAAVAAFFLRLARPPTAADVADCFHQLVNPGIKSRARNAFEFAESTDKEFRAVDAFDMCFDREPSDQRLYQVRNDIDHGNIVEFQLATRQRVQKCLGELSSIVLRLLHAVVTKKSTNSQMRNST